MRFFGNNGSEAMEEIDINDLSIFTLNKYLKNGQDVFLFVRSYYVGEERLLMKGLGGLTLGKESNVREEGQYLLAELMFNLKEWPMLVKCGEIVHYNGMEMIKVPVAINKEDILKAAAVAK